MAVKSTRRRSNASPTLAFPTIDSIPRPCAPPLARRLAHAGRNHTRVCNGQICELANDFDGFSGTIPKSAATVAEVLKDYGYNTGAWGKWHNTPTLDTTSKGPFEFWPSGYGFEYFYGFLAGEASQYEPRLVRNTTVLDPHQYEHPGYHLSEDIADDSIKWLREQQAFTPDKPFFMYFAPGAAHGPHQVPKEWADRSTKLQSSTTVGTSIANVSLSNAQERRAGFRRMPNFDSGVRRLSPRGDSIPEDEKPFQHA